MKDLKKALLDRAAENAFHNKDQRLANALYDEADRAAVDEHGMPENKHDELQEHLEQERSKEGFDKQADAALDKFLQSRKWYDKARKRNVKYDSLPPRDQGALKKRIQKQIDTELDKLIADKGKFYDKARKRRVKFDSLPKKQQGETRRRLMKNEVLPKLK